MATHSYDKTLKRRGRRPLFWTQVPGTFDNIRFKIIVSVLRKWCVWGDGRITPQPHNLGLPLASWRKADDCHEQEIAHLNRRAPIQQRRQVALRTNATLLLRNATGWRSFVLGGLTFLAAHAVEVAMWTRWFSAKWTPFFLNSARAVAFTTACAVIAGLIAGFFAKDRRDALIHAGRVTASEGVVMTFVIFWNGPGNLFPIAIGLGTAVLAVGSYLGALVTFPFKATSI